MYRLSCLRFARLFVLALMLVFSHVQLGAADSKGESRAPSYKLQPMDLIKVQVFQEPDMDRDLRVSKDNTIVLPLIGRIEVRNRSVREVELMLTELYKKDYLVNPQINITVIEYAPRTVNVLGAVNSPNAVPIPPERDLTFLDAIARCGGFSRLANRGHVSITRTLPDGRTESFTINADQVVSGDSSHRWVLQNGDVIMVPERVL